MKNPQNLTQIILLNLTNNSEDLKGQSWCERNEVWDLKFPLCESKMAVAPAPTHGLCLSVVFAFSTWLGLVIKWHDGEKNRKSELNPSVLSDKCDGCKSLGLCDHQSVTSVNWSSNQRGSLSAAVRGHTETKSVPLTSFILRLLFFSTKSPVIGKLKLF